MMSSKTSFAFLHGLWGTEEYFKNAIKHCNKVGIPAYSVNLPGHGHQEDPAGVSRLTLASYVEFIRNWLSEFEAPPIVVGQGLGATIFAKILETTPWHIDQAVFFAPEPPKGIHIPMSVFWRMLAYPRYMEAILTGRGFVVRPKDLRSLLLGSLPACHQDDALTLFGPESGRVTREIVFGIPISEEIAKKRPVHVLSGTDDKAMPLEKSRKIARAMGVPKENFIPLPSRGYMPLIEPGWQIVMQIIFEATKLV